MKEKQKIVGKSSKLIIIGMFLLAFTFGNMFSVGMIQPVKVLAEEVNTTFTIKPTSNPCNKSYLGYTTYNDYTKHYYLLRSYMEKLEKLGGGTLILKKGVYKISNTIYVPSNVTIQFQDGVTIKKLSKTGTTKFSASKSIFQMISPSKSALKGVYGGYKGEKNIHFTGTGTVIFDMAYNKDCVGFIFAHNTNVSVSGITFKNMYGGHFIELDASKGVVIENNTFTGFKSSSTGIKEAINIDTPDKKTEGFNSLWTKYDCTPNKNVVIQNNVFDKLEKAIGTHKYSQNKYHDNIQILNNKISNIETDAIRMMNWTNAVITGNEITNVIEAGDRGILASGVKNPTIQNNIFTNVPRAIQLMAWKNTGAGSEYAITYNEISQSNIDAMLQNKIVGTGELFIRNNKTYNVYDKDTDKYYFPKENISQ